MAETPKEARIVTVPLRDNVHVVGVRDPNVGGGANTIAMDVDFTGTHYSLSLSEIMNAAAPAATPFAFAAQAMVCPNAADDPKDQNTLAIQPPELIKLDCGYWGSYIKNGQRRAYRDFGLIQGQWVWQCKFDPSTPHGNLDAYIPAGPSAVRSFLDAVKAKGFGVQIVNYTQATSSPATRELDPDRLYFILPDLHLPERWPDEPDWSQHRHKDPDAREALQAELIVCQHAVGWKWFVDMDTKRQRLIQSHLEELIDKGNRQKGWTVTITRTARSDLEYVFTATEFLAELAFVERRIKAASTWFYGEGLPQSQRMTGPKPRHLAPLDKGVMGDPAPAVDLSNLLLILKEVQKEKPVTVVQLGDLLEMWIGREFLYRFFPTTDAPLGGNAPTALNLATGSLGVSDELQLRRDSGWQDATNPSMAGFKHYVFDPVDHWELLERHKTGSYMGLPASLGGEPEKNFYISIGMRQQKLEFPWATNFDPAIMESNGRSIVSRLRGLVTQRFNNTWNFCMPAPEKDTPGIRVLKTYAGFMDTYKRPDSGSIPNDEHDWSTQLRYNWTKSTGEYFWNRMILDLLQQLKFINIHGNHDGYRSDPLLRGGLPASFQAQEVLESASPGIWFEHGHRWDGYNRDGRFFGAGMTNLVYYQFDDMIGCDESTIKAMFTDPAEQASEQPGAAQWFRMVDFLPAGSKPGFEERKKFAIYVSGHTHGADLVRMKFMSAKDYSALRQKEIEEELEGMGD